MIRWRLHLSAAPEAVRELLGTDAGRARFWAESAVERAGVVEFRFPNGEQWRGRVLVRDDRVFALDYFGSPVRFELDEDGSGGTDLTLTHQLDDPETRAGWISVLLALKAAADFGVDLRNHDPRRTWSDGYVDN